jgi:hypothetical protein
MFNRQNITSFILFFAIIIVYGYFSLFNSIFLSVLILIAYVSYHKYNSTDEHGKVIQASLKAVFAASILAFTAFTYKSYGPRDWDFTCFFLYGNVAANGMDFYNPADYYSILKTIHIPIELNAGFYREVIDVGCPYPPPTLLLFSILSFFTYDNALIIWTILNIVFLIGSIALVRNIFFSSRGIESVMISVALVLTFHSTLTTIFYSQILFILLFFLLLFYKYRSKPWSGGFLAIAIFLKPFTAILLLYLILARQKKAVLFFIISCLAICLVTGLMFGFQPFIEYIINNPNNRAPELLFTEFNNQSLLAELFRNLPGNKFAAKVLYYLISVFVVFFFGSILYQKRNNTDLYGVYFVVLLAIALLLYPSGQYNYPLVHLVSMLILLNYLKRLDNAALFIFLFYLVSYAGLFYLNLFLLLACVLLINKDRVGFIYFEIRNFLKSGT